MTGKSSSLEHKKINKNIETQNVPETAQKISQYYCLLNDLTTIYKAAFENNNFVIALKALEIKAKHLNFIKERKNEECTKSLEEMTDQELLALIGKDKKLRLSKKPPPSSLN